MRESCSITSSYTSIAIGLHIFIIGYIHIVYDEAHPKSVVKRRKCRTQLNTFRSCQVDILDRLSWKLLEYIGEGKQLELRDRIFVQGNG